MPPGAKTPGKPSEAAHGSSLPWKMYTVSGEPVNLKNKDWMKTKATYSVSSQCPFFLSHDMVSLLGAVRVEFISSAAPETWHRPA